MSKGGNDISILLLQLRILFMFPGFPNIDPLLFHGPSSSYDRLIAPPSLPVWDGPQTFLLPVLLKRT